MAATAFGCGGGGGGGGTPAPAGLTATFAASGSASSPDFVRLRSGTVTGSRVVLEVAMGGPTSSSDLYSFAFDLVLSDVTVARYVSATATVGDALSAGGGQTLHAEAAQVGDHVVVGVTKLGGGAGNSVSGSETVVVRLTFQALKAGASSVTFAGSTSPQNPTASPAVLDSHGALIPGGQFDAAPAILGGA